MPTFDKISHLSFSARDKEACAAWYQRVLGFVELDRVQGEGWTGVLLLHPASAVVVEFQQHDDNDGEPFDPRRTGLDHVGLRVTSRAELDDWQAHLAAHDVDLTPVVDREYGSVLTFRDPDERQLELFYREDHP